MVTWGDLFPPSGASSFGSLDLSVSLQGYGLRAVGRPSWAVSMQRWLPETT